MEISEVLNEIKAEFAAYQEGQKAFNEKIDEQFRHVESKGVANEKLAADLTKMREALGEQGDHLEKLRTQLEEMRISREPGDLVPGVNPVVEQVLNSSDFKEFCRRGFRKDAHVSIPLEGGLFGDRKATTITSSTVGSSTSGILTPARVRGYVPAAERRLTIRDILPSSPIQSNAVEFPKENVFTNAASPQTEAGSKGESALTFTIGTANVRTLAHWIPATAQVLDDWAMLGRIIEDKMLYGLKLKEENELLTGDGTGVHLTGLVTGATSYAGTYNVANDTSIDRLRWAILEAEDDDEEVDFVVLNPKNFWTILGVKAEEAGTANKGSYIMGNPAAGAGQFPTIWGKQVVKTNSMTADYFLVGNSAQAEVFDRMQATVSISTEHSDYFIKNMVAIRVEERLAFAIFRAGAFIYGGF